MTWRQSAPPGASGRKKPLKMLMQRRPKPYIGHARVSHVIRGRRGLRNRNATLRCFRALPGARKDDWVMECEWSR